MKTDSILNANDVTVRMSSSLKNSRICPQLNSLKNVCIFCIFHISKMTKWRRFETHLWNDPHRRPVLDLKCSIINQIKVVSRKYTFWDILYDNSQLRNRVCKYINSLIQSSTTTVWRGNSQCHVSFTVTCS